MIRKEILDGVFGELKDIRKESVLFNRKEGKYVRRWNNGKIALQCTYKNGELIGEFNQWWENGNPWISCFYQNGKLTGEYKDWWDDGQLLAHYFLFENKIVWSNPKCDPVLLPPIGLEGPRL